jgi:D-alanyl-D-alanine carboxypeptidase
MKMRWRLVAATMVLMAMFALAPAALATTGGPSPATAAQRSDDAALRASLKSKLEEFLSNQRTVEHISGVSLRVTFRGDKPSINIPVGTKLYGGGEPLSTTDLWQIGSNTKAFTAVMLLQLEAENKLSIHDTVGKWLPRYRAWRHVKIKQLLNMTSGIPDYFNVPFFRAYAADPNTKFSSRRLISYAKRGRPTHGWSYSNTNYVLAGMILRKVTRDTYGQQLRKRIIKPLGLPTMAYRTGRYPPAFTDRLPAAYLFQPSVPQLAPLVGRDLRRTNLSYARAAGGIVSSLKDATKWERALYEGRLLPRKQQSKLESLVSVKTGKPIRKPTRISGGGYGLGVIKGLLDGIGPVWNYEGETLGHRVLHIYVPRSGTLIAVAANSSPSDSADQLATLGDVILLTLHDAGAA